MYHLHVLILHVLDGLFDDPDVVHMEAARRPPFVPPTSSTVLVLGWLGQVS